MKRTHRVRVLLVGACLAGIAAGTTFAFVRPPGNVDDDVPPAKGSIAALSRPAPTHTEPEVAHLLEGVGANPGDENQFRVLARDLGPFNSRLVAVSARAGRTICYALLGEKPTDPAGSYCYQPHNPIFPPSVTRRHFDVMASTSYTDGAARTQLFGIAFDDVAEIRAQVKGEWVDVPLRNNGFYLHLPGVDTRVGDVPLVEATLQNGSKQYYNVLTGG